MRAPGWTMLGVGIGAGLPAAVTLVVLLLFDQVGLVAALAAWTCVAAFMSVLLWRHLQALQGLVAWAGEIGEGPSSLPYDGPVPPSCRDLARSLHQLRRKFDENARKKEARDAYLEQLLDALPAALLVVGDGDRIERANRSARDLFPAVKSDRRMAEVTRVPEVMSALAEARENDAPNDAEFTLPEPDGRILKVTAHPFDFGDGVRGAVLMFEDRTAQRLTERARGDFIANASHAIRTPLTAIAGMIETLAGPARNDEAVRDRFLERLDRQARRLGHLVDELMILSQVEMDQHALPENRVDLVPLVRTVIQEAAWQAEARKVQVSVRVPGTSVPVRGDAGQLQQMVANLLDNALKHGREGGKVSVEVRNPEARRAEIDVIDDGPGIVHEDLARITERFYRASGTRAPGHGLGLAIVKHVVRRHRGALNIASEPGAGSHFSVRLPVDGPEGEKAP